MQIQVENREFVLSSPVSRGRRLKLTPDLVDDEVTKWETKNIKGEECLVLHGNNTVLCILRFMQREGKFMGHDIRGGVTTLTPIIPMQTPVEGVRNALMQRIANNKNKPQEDATINSKVKLPWDQGRNDIARVVDSFPKTSNKAIAVVGCNRPGYMKQVIDAIKKNDISDYDVYLFLDKPPISSEIPMQQQQALMGLTDRVIMMPFNFGCGQALIEVRRQMFDRKEYDKVFIFEDDMVPSSNYLAYCERLLEWGQSNYTNVGAVQGWHKCVMPIEDKRSRTKQVHATYTNWWGYLMTREAWDQIKGVLYTYRDSFLQKSYKARPTIPILSFFKPMAQRNFHLREGGFQPDAAALTHRRNLFDSPPSGQDGATWLAMDNANLVRLAPTVNRGLYIGEIGIHSTAEIFRKDRFDRMTLEEYPNDTRLKNFEAR